MGKDKQTDQAAALQIDPNAKVSEPKPDGEGLMTTDAHLEGHGVED